MDSVIQYGETQATWITLCSIRFNHTDLYYCLTLGQVLCWAHAREDDTQMNGASLASFKHMHIHKRAHIHKLAHIHTYTHKSTHTRTHAHSHAHICTYIHTYICTYKRVCTAIPSMAQDNKLSSPSSYPRPVFTFHMWILMKMRWVARHGRVKWLQEGAEGSFRCTMRNARVSVGRCLTVPSRWRKTVQMFWKHGHPPHGGTAPSAWGRGMQPGRKCTGQCPTDPS